VGWLGVPKIEVLAHFLKESEADWFSSGGKYASGKID
jgi:hypothetical protein